MKRGEGTKEEGSFKPVFWTLNTEKKEKEQKNGMRKSTKAGQYE